MNDLSISGWQCPICKIIHAPTVKSCPCSTNKMQIKEETKNIAHWKVWGGWTGNHDQRIEDAECSNCGNIHPTVYKSLKNLSKYCAGCGYTMELIIE